MTIPLMDQVRHLRPGMTRADVDQLSDASGGMLTSATLIQDMSNRKSNWPFEVPKPCQISFDTDGIIRRVSFPPEASPVAAVQAGMTKEHLVQLFPKAMQLPKFDLGTTSQDSIWIFDREPLGIAVVAFFGSNGKIASVQFREEDALLRQNAEGYALMEAYALKRAEEARQQELERIAAKKAWDEKQEWKRTAPPNEVLLDWAGSHSAWGEGSAQWLTLANWLIESSTPDDRHVILQNYNWDHGLDLILWIVRQPDTELATVLDALWKIEDEVGVTHMVWQEGGRPKNSGELYDLFVEMGDRLRNGFYKRSSNPIDFGGMTRHVVAVEEWAEIVRKLIPDVAYQKIDGREVTDKTHKLNMPVDIGLLC